MFTKLLFGESGTHRVYGCKGLVTFDPVLLCTPSYPISPIQLLARPLLCDFFNCLYTTMSEYMIFLWAYSA